MNHTSTTVSMTQAGLHWLQRLLQFTKNFCREDEKR